MPLSRRTSAVLTLALLAGPAAGAELMTLAGKKISGDFLSVSDKGVELKVSGSPLMTPTAEVMYLDLGNALAPDKEVKFAEVELTDGSVFRCSQVKLKGRTLELTTLGDRVVRIPVEAVSTVLREAQDATNKQQWVNFLNNRVNKRDYFVRKDEDDGTLKGFDGTIGEGDATGDAFKFEFAGGKTSNVKLRLVHGLVFRPSGGGEIAATLCKVTDTERNVLVARKVSVRDADKALVVTTVAGVAVEYPSAEQVAKVDYTFGKQMFLSDLTPVSVEHEDTNESFVTFTTDRHLWDNEPLKLGGAAFTKGLAVHARTVLSYNLGGEYKEFKAVLGIDDAVKTGSSRVKFTVEGDGRRVFAAEVTRKDKPRPVTLDVKGVKLLRLTVESVDDFDAGNQLDLADAKLMK
jgi:hypothetical protein